MDRRSRDEVGEKSARRRTLTAAFSIFVLMPATIAFSTLVLDGSRYMITSLLIIVYTMIKKVLKKSKMPSMISALY